VVTFFLLIKSYSSYWSSANKLFFFFSSSFFGGYATTFYTFFSINSYFMIYLGFSTFVGDYIFLLDPPNGPPANGFYFFLDLNEKSSY
jgi:hypothetical protein